MRGSRGQQHSIHLNFESFGETEGASVERSAGRGLIVQTVLREGRRALYFSDGEEMNTLVMTRVEPSRE
ncbi:hypothetical protein GCM10022198_22210 [Klugiella xanthotipulae]